MTVLSSQIDTRSETFKRNAEAMRAQLSDLRQRTDQIRLGGGEESRKRHVARGKLLPRERVRALLDPGSPFLELSPLAALGMYDDESPGASVITGIGRVSGVRMHDRLQRRHRQGRHLLSDDGEEASSAPRKIAMENRLPCLYLVDSGGANLPHWTEVFPTATTSDASSSIRRACRRTASRRLPSSWARARRAAPMCRPCPTRPSSCAGRARSSSAGPPLVKAATARIVSAEDLGGADVHTRLSGVADHYALNDRHALEMARNIIANAALLANAPTCLAGAA
jgi:3-methylcrotonyl-CoA carboxylase beta subunit